MILFFLADGRTAATRGSTRTPGPKKKYHGGTWFTRLFVRFGIGGEKSSKYTFSADERSLQPEAEGTDT